MDSRALVTVNRGDTSETVAKPASFSWNELRLGLLRELRDELQLGRGRPDISLGKEIGVPDDKFVQVTWPVLRDRWLSTEATTRRSVVDALREKHLGDLSIKVGTTKGDVAYLRSCKNSGTLRSIVLDHLLAAGSSDRSYVPMPANSR